MDSQAISEQMQSLLEKIRRLEDAYNGGWISAVEESWTYAGADDTVKTYTLNVPGDLSWKYGKGMRVRLKQAGIISYFIITGVAYSAPSTTLTLYAGTDYSLANSRIIEPYFSMAKAPYGFPVDEAKWRVESLVTSDSSQASPTAGTWYNKGGSLTIPIGRWRVEYAAELEVTRAAAGALDVFAILSTAANSEVNKETTTKIGISSGVSMRGSVSLCGYLLDLAAKGTYYLNCKTGQASMTAITFKGSEQKTKVRAVCGYL
jgi:hypothetical protein